MFLMAAQPRSSGIERQSARYTSGHDFAPARFSELNGGVIDLAPVYFFVLVGELGPRTQPQADVITGTQAGGRHRFVVAHAPKVNERFQRFVLIAARRYDISEMKSEDVILVRDAAGSWHGRDGIDCSAHDNFFAGSRHEEVRSEEHTSELQSRSDLVCRLLLEKKKQQHSSTPIYSHAHGQLDVRQDGEGRLLAEYPSRRRRSYAQYRRATLRNDLRTVLI